MAIKLDQERLDEEQEMEGEQVLFGNSINLFNFTGFTVKLLGDSARVVSWLQLDVSVL